MADRDVAGGALPHSDASAPSSPPGFGPHRQPPAGPVPLRPAGHDAAAAQLAFPVTPAPPLTGPVPRSSWPLDQSMQRLAGGPAWGVRPVLTPVLTFVVVVVVGQVLGHTLHPHTTSAKVWATVLVNGGAQLALAAGVWWGGRRVAAANGGWSTFGWARPRGRDVGAAAIGVAVVFAGRYLINLVLGAATGGAAVRQAQNLHVTHFSWTSAIVLTAVAVVAAPLLEEFTFRGLLLRTFMRRWSFAPAAVASAVIFAVFHTYEVSTVLGAVTLALVVAVLGATNCVLVRYSDRLAPGIGVHAVMNGLSTAVLLVVAAR